MNFQTKSIYIIATRKNLLKTYLKQAHSFFTYTVYDIFHPLFNKDIQRYLDCFHEHTILIGPNKYCSKDTVNPRFLKLSYDTHRAIIRAYAAYAGAYAEIRQGMPGIRPKKAPFKKIKLLF